MGQKQALPFAAVYAREFLRPKTHFAAPVTRATTLGRAMGASAALAAGSFTLADTDISSATTSLHYVWEDAC